MLSASSCVHTYLIWERPNQQVIQLLPSPWLAALKHLGLALTVCSVTRDHKLTPIKHTHTHTLLPPLCSAPSAAARRYKYFDLSPLLQLHWEARWWRGGEWEEGWRGQTDGVIKNVHRRLQRMRMLQENKWVCACCCGFERHACVCASLLGVLVPPVPPHLGLLQKNIMKESATSLWRIEVLTLNCQTYKMANINKQ